MIDRIATTDINVEIPVIYQHLFSKAKYWGFISPSIIARYLTKGLSQRKKLAETRWLIDVLATFQVQFINDEAYIQIVDNHERKALELEERFDLPIEKIFSYLYNVMELTIEEISQFLSLSPQLIINFLEDLDFKRRSNDVTRYFVPEVEEAIEEGGQISEKLTSMRVSRQPLPSEDLETVGPLLRKMDKAERQRIKHSIDFYMSRKNSSLSQAYYLEVSQYRLLNADEEKILAKLFAKGDITAQDHFVLANLRLIFRIANIYFRRYEGKLNGMGLSDIIQEGFFGLMRATTMFDPELDYKFSTYATWWIEQAIERAIYEQGFLVRKPVHAHEKLQEIRRVQYNYNQKYGSAPSVQELAALTGFTLNIIRDILWASGGDVSINKKPDNNGNGDDQELAEYLLIDTEIDPLLLNAGFRKREEFRNHEKKICSVIRQMPLRDQIVVSGRFGILGLPEMTLETIGSKNQLTRERIRQIEGSILEQLGGDAESTKEYLKNLFKKMRVLDEALEGYSCAAQL